MTLVLISTFFLVFYISFRYPKLIGWCFVGLIPILGGIPHLLLIPHPFLFLNPDRLGMLITIAVILFNKNKVISVLRNSNRTFLISLLLFLLILFASSLRDLPLHGVIVNQLLYYLYPVFLSCFLISTQNDVMRLLKIYAWSSGIIGSLCILEYYTRFNLTYYILSSWNPQFTVEHLSLAEGYRAGFFRVNGTELNAVFTSARLAFFFPITVWYASQNKIIGKLTMGVTIIGLLFLQSRAAIFSAICTYLIILILTGTIKNIAKNILSILIVFTALFFVASVTEVFEAFFQQMFLPFLSTVRSIYDLDAQRAWSLGNAVKIIIKHPFIGYGSPSYAYYDVMLTNDTPAPLLYMISGGVPLGLLYLAVMGGMPYYAFKLVFSKRLTLDQRSMVLCSAAAFIGGIIPLLGNHYYYFIPTMFLLFTGMWNVFKKVGTGR